jgi:hypothetical protein
MIRNCSGAMDEFCLFSRALDGTEIRTLYAEGKPEPGSFGRTEELNQRNIVCSTPKPSQNS